MLDINQGADMILKALVLGSERLDGKGGIANWRLWQVCCGTGSSCFVLWCALCCAPPSWCGVGSMTNKGAIAVVGPFYMDTDSQIWKKGDLCQCMAFGFNRFTCDHR